MARVPGWVGSHPEKRIGLRTAAIYVVAAGLWIVASDRVLALLLRDSPAGLLSRAQTYKGLFYVLVTAWLLYALVSSSVRKVIDHERSRQESEKWFRLLLDHVGDAVFAFRRGEGGRPERCIEVNGQACNLSGRSRDDLLRSDLTGIGFTEIERQWSEIESELASNGMATRIVHQDDAVDAQRLVEAHVRPVRLQNAPVVVLVLKDVTERVRLETSVASSEASYRFVMEQASDAILISDAEGIVLAINSRGAEMIGAPAERIRGRRLSELTRPEMRVPSSTSAPRPQAWNPDAWKGLFEAQVIRSDGSTLDAEINATRLLDGRTLSIIRDVSARKRMAEEDRRRRTHAEAMARTAARLNAELDLLMAQRTICEETAAALQYSVVWIELGDERSQRLALTYGLGIPPEQLLSHGGIAQSEEEALLVRGGGSPMVLDSVKHDLGGMTEFVRKLGLRTIYRAEMRRTGSLVGTLNAGASDRHRTAHQDELFLFQGMADLAAQAITNARLYQENIEQLHTLNTLYAGARALSRTLDRDTVAENVARTCADVFGCRVAWVGLAQPDGTILPIASQPESLLSRFHDKFRWDESAPAAGATGQAIRTGQPQVATQVATGGSPFSRDLAMSLGLASSLALPLISKERAIGALTVYHDKPEYFTPQRMEVLQAYSIQAAVALESAEMHRELQEHASRLEARVEERTAQIQETNAALEAFAAAVSHDLRAPLRAIQGFADALLNDCADGLGDAGRDYATRISSAADRLDTQIRELLVYSRLSKGDLRLKTVALDRVVREVLTHLEAEVKGANAEIVVEGRLPEVHGEAQVLAQVLGNLVSNAIKFVAPGVRPQVHISADDAGGWVRVDVRDNGIGIAPEHQEKIFGIYERLHGIEAYPGTGLGLAIVRRGVERLGGRLGVSSAPDAGSTFWFVVPRPETAALSKPRAEATGVPGPAQEPGPGPVALTGRLREGEQA